ncbi:hypothetical protein [Pseudobacteroides cellulosolvens]|uniref:STAS/SEC14 domain-containing protein n=1 Tax=Pseudobacteroides cellulosolvens ATCC 35603 = DSM 2933 TaxID=398512 RepID=A0A0L6JHQ0_9FIRM|nr:hypothetical protein [Pseudobacteroides cellulosolvens]KNY25238.1 hypothetical protein Bccel_0495 [Pseudobacteroides cellulosolvens ATCC 35603 = DSM 2933]
MDMMDLTKIAKNSSYEISVNVSSNILIITFLGLWDKTSQLEYYLEDIMIAIDKLTPGFNAIVDLTLYKGSTSEFIHLHVEAQTLALTAGLNKTAVILRDNPMLKVTIEFIFKQSGAQATYFNSFQTAEHWLSLLCSPQSLNSKI